MYVRLEEVELLNSVGWEQGGKGAGREQGCREGAGAGGRVTGRKQGGKGAPLWAEEQGCVEGAGGQGCGQEG